jgi:hypothetical protein
MMTQQGVGVKDTCHSSSHDHSMELLHGLCANMLHHLKQFMTMVLLVVTLLSKGCPGQAADGGSP